MLKTAEDRLLELLKVRDEQLENLAEELLKLKREKFDKDWEWARHRRQPFVDGLPIPRLQVLMTEATEYTQHWEFCLVTKTIHSDENLVPLGTSRRSGGIPYEQYAFPGVGSWTTSADLHFMPTICIDMRHYVEQLNIPGFLIIDDMVFQFEAHDCGFEKPFDMKRIK